MCPPIPPFPISLCYEIILRLSRDESVGGEGRKGSRRIEGGASGIRGSGILRRAVLGGGVPSNNLELLI